MPDKHRIEVTYGLATLNPELMGEIREEELTIMEGLQALALDLFWNVFMPALAFTCFFTSFLVLSHA